LVASIFLVFAITAKSTPVTPTLVLTEVSSTTLTYSWNGGAAQTVTATTADYWQFSIPNPSNPGYYETIVDPTYVGTVNINWQEPDYATSGEVNSVRINQYEDNSNLITVYSDVLPGENNTYPPFANGAVYSFDTEIPNVSDGNTVQFNDDGDASVPDGGITACLLGMGVMALGVLRRKFNCMHA
jgi:hypothetical protein